MVDDVCMLIAEGVPVYDSEGNEVVQTEERQVLCKVGSVTRSEFYQAATADLRPELTVYLSNAVDYAGEKLVRYPAADDGDLYSVIRTYRGGSRRSGAAGPDSIELILTRKVGHYGERGEAAGQNSE